MDSELRRKIEGLIARWKAKESTISVQCEDAAYQDGTVDGYHDAAEELEEVLNGAGSTQSSIWQIDHPNAFYTVDLETLQIRYRVSSAYKIESFTSLDGLKSRWRHLAGEDLDASIRREYEDCV